jgi:cellulose biosynthesis protein BcsQ
MIITFASSKGGVGKSTSCVALAGAYARAGQRVHIIDLDGNKTASRWLGDDSSGPPTSRFQLLILVRTSIRNALFFSRPT